MKYIVEASSIEELTEDQFDLLQTFPFVKLTPYTEPERTQIVLRVIPARTPDNMCVAHAIVNGAIINSASTPSVERSLRALGYENPEAHSHKQYRFKYGHYELVLEQPTPETIADEDLAIF